MEQKGHLGQELFLRLSDPGVAGGDPQELESARRHVAECAACRKRLGEYQTVQRGLAALKIRSSDHYPPGPDCPSREAWAELTAGLIEEKDAAELVKHAARCGHCGPLLRNAAEDLSEDYSEDELQQIRVLPSSSLEGRKRLAARMQQSGTEGRPQRPAWTKWAWGTAAVAAAIAGAIVLVEWLQTRPAAAEKLLAQAYSANRTLELRIPGAIYAPMSTVRGGATAAPLPLLSAEVMIGRKLQSQPASPAWMALQGRALLLEGKFAEARSTLEQAHRLRPNSAATLVDLATSEYELAEQESRDEDYMSAVEHLTQALELRHNDPNALFNRALVYERIGSVPLAIQDWDAYLRVDPSSAWARKVAREHLDELKKKVGSSPQSGAPPTDPSQAAGWLEQRLQRPPPSTGAMDSSDETLLETAVTRWLPDSFSPTNEISTAGRVAARRALHRLAEVLVKRHGDQWLADVLAAAPAAAPSRKKRELWEGIQALSQSIAAATAGQLERAQKQAEQAKRLLSAAGNPAAALRAQLALAYAYQLQVGSANRCAATAGLGLAELGHRPYPWLKGQFLIEQASGDVRMKRAGLAIHSAEQAAETSRAADYGVSYLRSVGALAAMATVAGNYRRAWQWDRKGLEQYWRGKYPPAREFQFYSDMGFGAEAAGDWKLAEALEQEDVEAATRMPGRRWEAMARFRLATLANLAGDPETARQEFERAGQIFAKLPPDPEVRKEEAYVQVYLANLELQTGDTASALKRLQGAEPLVGKTRNDELGLDFYGGLGNARLAANVGGAEQALLKAVAIAERGLYSLHSNAERVSWAQTTAGTYRSLVRAELKERADAATALAIWEWYRSGPVRAEQNRSSALKRLLAEVAQSPGDADAGLPTTFRAQAANWLESEPKRQDKTSRLVYAQFADGIEIWSLRGDATESKWVPVNRPEFEFVAKRFDEECADPKSNLDALRRDGRRLYDWLIAPVSGDLRRGGELAVETDGAISGLALGALVAPDGAILGSRFAVVYSPGIGYYRMLRQERGFTTAARLLSVGAPALGGDWQARFAPLPNADTEARTIAADFHSAVVLTGRQANLDTVMSDMPTAEIFHFAGHALAEGKKTGLVLAATKGSTADEEGAEVMEARELNPQELRECRLAVLSACQTASGEEKEPVNPASLVGAFLVAGVPDVVASRWNVDSAATTRLMEVFYRHLLSGESVAEALREAKTGIRQDPETSHPYYWAGFGVYGR